MPHSSVELKHPVNQDILTQLGDMTVSFAMLEDTFRSLLGSLLNEHQRVGQIIASSLSFKVLRDVVVSLFRERHGDLDIDLKALEDLSKRAGVIEEERNRFTHSTWGAGLSPTESTRIRVSVREKNGLRFQFEELGEDDVKAFNVSIRALANEVLGFRVRLVGESKLVNNPIQKTW